MKHYKFDNPSMPCDESKTDPKTGIKKITKYKEIHVIAENDDEARLKGKVSDDYQLVGVYTLNNDWSFNG